MIDKFAEMTFHSALRSWLLPEIIYNQKEIKSFEVKIGAKQVKLQYKILKYKLYDKIKRRTHSNDYE